MKVILYIASVFVATTCLCQNKKYSTEFNVAIGAGIPETFHGGIRINHKQWHFDTSLGTTFEELFTVNGNAAYHFGAKNTPETYELKRWFTSLGISYMQWESSKVFGEDVYLNGRIGRDIKMNDWFKLSLSVGLGANLYHYKYDKDPGGWDFDIWLPVIPSAQFYLQFRLFDIKH